MRHAPTAAHPCEGWILLTRIRDPTRWSDLNTTHTKGEVRLSRYRLAGELVGWYYEGPALDERLRVSCARTRDTPGANECAAAATTCLSGAMSSSIPHAGFLLHSAHITHVLPPMTSTTCLPVASYTVIVVFHGELPAHDARGNGLDVVEGDGDRAVDDRLWLPHVAAEADQGEGLRRTCYAEAVLNRRTVPLICGVISSRAARGDVPARRSMPPYFDDSRSRSRVRDGWSDGVSAR